MSRLDGVDISGYDEGIRIADVDADFIIVKSTEGVQGTRYNPSYRQMADAVLATNRLLGFYHYSNGGNPIAEADCFYDSIADYRGRAVACLDWEGQGNPTFETGRDVEWCEAFLDRIAERFGGTPLIYTGKYTCLAYDWSPVAAKYPLWGAMYATDGPTYGYQDDPWQTSEPWGAWGSVPLIHQYTGNLVLESNGGIEAFDGNVFHGSREDWMRLCGGDGGSTVVAPDTRTYGLPMAERIAQIAEHIAEHDEHGYSQPNRAGDGTIETITLSDGSTVQIHGMDYDCSDMARMCAAAAGALPWDYYESYTWTGNADDVLTAHDFVRIPFDWDETRRGDLLWVSGHMGVALGDGMQADAHGDEYGGIDGPNQGDQTGHEIEIRDLQWYWTRIYRYAGPEQQQAPKEGDDEMCAIIRPDQKEFLIYVSGGTYRRLTHPDQAEAVRMAYKTCMGRDIPQFELGTPDEPWGTRLMEALKEV